MTHAYDPKVVALTALGLACFAFGFSVTAVAYPRVALETPHAAATEHGTTTRVSVLNAKGARASTTRGCQLGE